MPRFPYGLGLNVDFEQSFASDYYPAFPAATGGQQGTMYTARNAPDSSGGIDTTSASMGLSAAAASNVAVPGNQKSILVSGLVLVALWILLTWSAKKSGDEADFRNIKASFYNVLTIGLAAIIFFPVAKYLATRFRVPGLSTWIQAA